MALSDLQSYYERIGEHQRARWAVKEQKNLAETQDFYFEGVSEPAPPVRGSMDPASEEYLVENMVTARNAYRKAADELAQYYEERPEDFKAFMIHTMQARFHPEETYDYLFRVILPPDNLEPVEVIPLADEMYYRAEQLHIEGRQIPAAADYEKQRESLKLFRELIRQYPTSTKIAMAAYYIGEIYKEYFREHYLATLWYERSWTWDPYVPKPARFQAAVQFDLNLHDRARAVELYKACLEFEPYYPSHVQFATERVEKLQAKIPTPRSAETP